MQFRKSSVMEFGTHCSLESCQRLDFLPFICEACSQVFCKEHSSPKQHQCSCYGELTKPQLSHESMSGPSASNHHPCDLGSCGRSELVPIECEHCHGNFCITHRHPDAHMCRCLPTTSGTNVTKKTPSLQHGPHERKGVGRRSEKCSQMVAMMRLKQTAKGPISIAQSQRVYYNVTLPNGNTKPLYFSKDWSVGKVIDHIAAMFKFSNNCHQHLAGPRLLLLSSDKTTLDTSLPLGTQQTSGSDIQLVYQ